MQYIDSEIVEPNVNLKSNASTALNPEKGKCMRESFST